MPSKGIVDRLAAGDLLLMDGGMGSSLERWGVDTQVGAPDYAGPIDADEWHQQAWDSSYQYAGEPNPSKMRRLVEAEMLTTGPWTALANVSHGEIVRQVHEDFLKAGADIILTNNFWTCRSKLDMVGCGDEWERYARAAAELTVAARDSVNQDAYVVGAMAPSPGGDMREEFADRARLMADAGVDVLMPEFLGAIDECVLAVEACSSVGLPIFIAVRKINEDGTMQYRESFEDLARALDGLPVAAVLMMCSPPKYVTAGLPKLRAAFAGPIGLYPNEPLGEVEPHRQIERLVSYAGQWKEMGAQIIGGCCGTGPEHIAALGGIVKGYAQLV